jgi:putative glutamine amidotransferase
VAIRPRIAIPVLHSEREYAERALPQYERAIEMAGAEPVRVPLDLSNPDIARIATRCDAILLPGSKADITPEKYGASQRHPRTAPADPARDNVDELLLQDAYNMRKPILAICYGLQSLNVWRTGTLVQHIESTINHQPGHSVLKAHKIEVEPGSLLADVLGRSGQFEVNSSHHQAADVVGDGLRVAARSPEDHVIEAMEGTMPSHFVLAVQWHPERMVEDAQAARATFRALVEAARRHRRRPRTPTPDFESLPR